MSKTCEMPALKTASAYLELQLVSCFTSNFNEDLCLKRMPELSVERLEELAFSFCNSK